MSKKQVVIVGGGGAGALLARTLSQKLDGTKYNLTLVSAHASYVFYVATLRMLMTEENSLEKRVFIPYDKLFVNGNGTFKHGVVTEIKAEKGSESGGKVVLEGGEILDYDVLVLSPGGKWEGFLDFPFEEGKLMEHVKEWRGKFKNAKKVAIAGGGAVGIELAGEIRQYYPDTKVTLVHGGKKLLNDAYPDKFRADTERRIRALGVDLILDDYIDTFPASATRKGVALDADLVLSARGSTPNTSWIASSLGGGVLTEQGRLRIKSTLQLDAYPNIYALGDVIDFPEQKQLGKYGGHVSVAATNIQSSLTGSKPKQLYKGGFEVIFITMGKAAGAGFFGVLWGLMFGGWVVSMVKGKGLFVDMTRKNLGMAA
ncbi:FAD/NAD-P-binding domain-containing protein [Ramaria rubella]|nr:FAD/NAD-P-binding domain-containing protein [Ramaria rubella]